MRWGEEGRVVEREGVMGVAGMEAETAAATVAAATEEVEMEEVAMEEVGVVAVMAVAAMAVAARVLDRHRQSHKAPLSPKLAR